MDSSTGEGPLDTPGYPSGDGLCPGKTGDGTLEGKTGEGPLDGPGKTGEGPFEGKGGGGLMGERRSRTGRPPAA